MWFVVKTPFGEEEQSKDLVLSRIPLVRDAYVPMQQVACKNAIGLQTFTQKPLLSGYLFVDLRAEADPSEAVEEESFSQKVWSRLKSGVTARGYFFYRDPETQNIDFLPGIRFLSGNYKETTPELFIAQSYIPDADMLPFIRYQETEKDAFLDKIEILDKSFESLAREHDTVRVISGPLKDVLGAIVQKRQEGNKRHKDHHLEVRFGRSMCISYPNIRRFNMVVVREAKEGARTRELRLWQEACHLMGLLQRSHHADDAPAFLEKTVDRIRREQQESVAELLKRLRHDLQTEELVRRLFYFANDLPLNASGSNKREVFDRYIPHTPIRPFLTPAEGEEDSDAVPSIAHRDFEELILPINLRPYFVGLDTDDRESYAYNAHVALFATGDHAGRLVVSWGRFYDAYASLSQPQKEGFLDDLQQKGYDRMHALLTLGHPCGEASSAQDARLATSAQDACLTSSAQDACLAMSAQGLHSAPSQQITFSNVGTIGGFATHISAGESPTQAARRLVSAAAPAAVEFWQRERLRNWRQLLQQSVFVRRQDARA